MANWFQVDAQELYDLTQMMEQYGSKAERIINDVLHKEGAESIKAKIAQLLPRSGRKWRGKRAAASAVMPGKFSQDNELLAVTVAARGAYGYLYFPDDGSNTNRHIGNQQFMMRGAEAAASDIIDKCLGKLTEDF